MTTSLTLFGSPSKIKSASAEISKARIVIWTTTPWTIPSNRAIAFNPKISYGLYHVDETSEESWTAKGDYYIIADNLASETLENLELPSTQELKMF